MHLQRILGATALCALYLGAATQPVKKSKTLDSRGRFGGDEPDEPVPVRGGGSDIPAGGAGSGPGSTNWGEALAFQPPASFTKDARGKGSFLTLGQGAQADLKNANGADASVAAVKDYPTNIKNYEVHDDETKDISTVRGLEELKTPCKDVGIDRKANFREVIINAGEDDPIHHGYYSSSQKAAIMSDLHNGRYGPDFTGNKVFQSQILFEEWSKEAGTGVGSLRWVVRSDISNEDTQQIIEDAQTATKGSVQKDTKVTFSATAAEGSAEKTSFDALAGSDNGRMVFRMLTDNHEAMGGKTVVACHTWVINTRGVPFYEMVWELSP